jgi:hypothetical protein
MFRARRIGLPEVRWGKRMSEALVSTWIGCPQCHSDPVVLNLGTVWTVTGQSTMMKCEHCAWFGPFTECWEDQPI